MPSWRHRATTCVRCTMLSSTTSSEAMAERAAGGTMNPVCPPDGELQSRATAKCSGATDDRSAAELGRRVVLPALAHRVPSLGPQLLERLHVALEDGLGRGE